MGLRGIFIATVFGHMTFCGRASSVPTSYEAFPSEPLRTTTVWRPICSAVCFKGANMKPSTKDQIHGAFHEMKGKAKEKAGQITNNPDLAAQGQGEKIAGRVQKTVGQIEEIFEK
jgi:uncharacterized protein YjbJ (UPF0337 family)